MGFNYFVRRVTGHFGWWRVGLPLAAGVVVSTAGAQVRPLVVGGTEALRGRYPWMVSLARSTISDTYDAHFCGGVLIHPYWVLTAAHCVERERPTTIDVVIGAHDLQTDVAPSVRRVAVREIVIHPDYDPETSDSDLALLVLASPVSDVTPVEVIDSGALCEPGEEAIVLGWGATAGNGTRFPAALQEVGLPLVALAEANELPAFDGTLTENMLPAGPAEGGRDSCQGDSGGPLIVNGAQEGVPMVAGVVSFGADTLDCGEPGGYGIYTRVVVFRDWIYSLMRPVYADWERRAGSVGERRDFDGDGWSQWEEFVRGEEPGWNGSAFVETVRVVPDGMGGARAAFAFRRRVVPEVRTQLFLSANGLSAWSPLDIDLLLAWPPEPVPGVPGVETVTIESPVPAGTAGFYRVVCDTAPVYVAGPRAIRPGQTLNHTLHVLDPLVSGTRAKDYWLADLADGATFSLTARSPAFDMALRLLDADTMKVVANSLANGAGGTDETLSFTPLAGGRYLARVSPVTGGASTGGRFSLQYAVASEAAGR